MTEHHGQHPRCRACGTNPRAALDRGENRGIPESSQTAREIEMAANEKRLAQRGPWTPLDAETREHARERLAEARAARDRAVAAKHESKGEAT